MTHSESVDRRDAAHLAEARAAGRRSSVSLDRTGLTLERAYAIQRAAIDAWEDKVVGWKIGRLPSHVRGPGGTGRFLGPVFEATVRRLKGAVCRIPVLSEAPNAIEAEYIVRLARPLTADASTFGVTEWLDVIAAVHVGVELAGNNLAELDQQRPYAQIAAFGNNRGLLIGDLVPLQNCGIPMTVSTFVEGECVGDTSISMPWEIITTALREAAGEAQAIQACVESGHWIATGALTGVHVVERDQNVVVRFAGCESLEMITSDIREWRVSQAAPISPCRR